MRRARAAVVLVAALAATHATDAVAAPDSESLDSARAGAAYLADRQDADGRVPPGPPGNPARADEVAEGVMALQAGGGQGEALARALDYLRSHAADGASSGPFTGRIVSGLVAAGENPRSFAGTDFVARLDSFYDPITGSYDWQNVNQNLYGHTLAVLGKLAAGGVPPAGAIERLTDNQCEDGGWGHKPDCPSGADTDTTAVVVSALADLHGAGSPAVVAGRAWLLEKQKPSGCWSARPQDPKNSNSCALAVSAVIALGEDPGTEPWASGDRDPLADLRGFQLASGGFRLLSTSSSANDYSTVQAVPALAGWSYPVSAPVPQPGVTTTTGARPRAAGSTTTTGPAAANGGGAGTSDQPGSRPVAGTATEVAGVTSSSAPRFGPAAPRPWALEQISGATDVAPGRVPDLDGVGRGVAASATGDAAGGVGPAGPAGAITLATAGAALATVWRRRLGAR